MKLLLDTHLLLWVAGQPQKLTRAAKALLSSKDHELLFSAASLWEIAIKRMLGRADFRADPRTLRGALLGNGYLELAITGEHAVAVAELQFFHKDPFDRLLLAQATVEGAALVTLDKKLMRYGAPVRAV